MESTLREPNNGWTDGIWIPEILVTHRIWSKFPVRPPFIACLTNWLITFLRDTTDPTAFEVDKNGGIASFKN